MTCPFQAERERLASWLRAENYRDWEVQENSPSGRYVVMWRAAGARPRHFLYGPTVEDLKEMIVKHIAEFGGGQ